MRADAIFGTHVVDLGKPAVGSFRYHTGLSEGKLKESKLIPMNSVCYFFYTVSLIFGSLITIYYTGGGAPCGVVGSLNISPQVLIFG